MNRKGTNSSRTEVWAEPNLRKTRSFLRRLGLPDRDLAGLPSTPKRFPDGAQFRIEIPSVESPEQLRRVIEKAEELEVPVHRISQGSGVMLLTDKEIEEMVEIGRSEKIEVSLFTGPRSSRRSCPSAPSRVVMAWL